MGGCMSTVTAPQRLVERVNGNEDDYHKHYLEGRVLGEGEFGVVKLVNDITIRSSVQPNEYACKILRKGVVFKANVLYSPIKPEVLRMEIDILRTLAGQHYCLQLCNIYESKSSIFIVTEYCCGGEMMQYVSNLMKQHECAISVSNNTSYDLTSDDISRISYQLLSAVHHCCRHHVIHRDIKPENILFQNPAPGSDLRLIDFGSGVLDKKDFATNDVDKDGLYKHKTFAGSAFYISPEMFQRDYNGKTDVWSSGVTIYVLVAGYPADCLQKAFNILQKKERVLKTDLPNMPSHMPPSFYDLLEKLLVYRHKHRLLASSLLQHEFLQLHKPIQQQEEEKQQHEKVLPSTLPRIGSVSLMGSAIRHTLFLDFRKFERSLTTLLATLLSKDELDQLVGILSSRAMETMTTPSGPKTTTPADPVVETEKSVVDLQKQHILSVCLVVELKDILRNQLKNSVVLETIARIPNAASFDQFAYHVELLVVFSSNESAKAVLTGISSGDHSTASSHRKSMIHQPPRRRGSFRRTHSYTNSTKISGNATSSMTGSAGSFHSLTSFRGLRNKRKVNDRFESSQSKIPGDFFAV